MDLKYRCYEADGVLSEEGTMKIEGGQISAPSRGSISLELSPEVWINILTSEWVLVGINALSLTWKDQQSEIIKRKNK